MQTYMQDREANGDWRIENKTNSASSPGRADLFCCYLGDWGIYSIFAPQYII